MEPISCAGVAVDRLWPFATILCSDGAVNLWDVNMSSSAPTGTPESKMESDGWRHLKTFRTRRTAICAVKFTHRNLLLTAGGTVSNV